MACLAVAVAAALLLAPRQATRGQDEEKKDKRLKAPELTGGVAWLNTAGPIKLADLKGKIVLLDFWTFCCINCIHVLPDLARLEKKYEKELVVIGVHSAKFQKEKDTEAIRKAILRYEIKHPVINDANMAVWETVREATGGRHPRSWPTLILIDPEGYFAYMEAGEGQYEDVDAEIARLIKKHKANKTLNDRPLKFQLASDGDSPLFFPGKVVTDVKGKRIFIADSTHHRIVVTDLEGNKVAIAGAGTAGAKDGKFDAATFNDPQGMALKGETLYVADRKNHLIRALDLKKQTVTTVAGTGEQGRDREADGPARKTGLNSPWDVLVDGDRLFIAMAGHHQIWVLDLKRDNVAVYAGTGREDVRDGSLARSEFAQPSGLSSDGKTLYVADSESSTLRAVPITGRGEVRTLVGVEGDGLFNFGDRDGRGEEVRLQHALGVASDDDGKVYVADTYNSKIKVVDPVKRTCKTLLGGEEEGWLAGPLFNEPGGIYFAGGKLYVADTNAHRIRIVDLKTKAVSTLKLKGVEAPKAK
jgi:DNA-binding beta-propeller fold protein YncE